MKKLVKK